MKPVVPGPMMTKSMPAKPVVMPVRPGVPVIHSPMFFPAKPGVFRARPTYGEEEDIKKNILEKKIIVNVMIIKELKKKIN